MISLNTSRTRRLKSSQQVVMANDSSSTVTTGGSRCVEQRMIRSFSPATPSAISSALGLVYFSLRTRLFPRLLNMVCHHPYMRRKWVTLIASSKAWTSTGCAMVSAVEQMPAKRGEMHEIFGAQSVNWSRTSDKGCSWFFGALAGLKSSLPSCASLPTALPRPSWRSRCVVQE
jgi:hypothetical protein